MGSRQVGKTYLLKEFGTNEYENIHFFDFQEKPALAEIFKHDLNPKRILEELSIQSKKDIDPGRDLIVFDEVQECEQALSSLKYFYDKMPEVDICAAGSLLGIKLGASSFPVGSVTILDLYPMNFHEFLIASGDDTALSLFEKKSRLFSAHEVMWEYLKQYFFTGGMPEAVAEWFSTDTINERIDKVRSIQNNIISGYEKDFAKHSGKINSLHITSVLENVPRQLAGVMDGSVKRFKFKDVIPGKRTYPDLAGPISWLINTGIIYPVYNIECEPRIPLKSFARDNRFKLFLFDIGLLGAMLELTYKDLADQKYGITKGYFAENFVVCEFISSGIKNLYSWSLNMAEIEFLIYDDVYGIIPVEVKSGKRLQAKSLKSYTDRYSPQKSIKLAGVAGNYDMDNMMLPIYFAGELRNIIRQ